MPIIVQIEAISGPYGPSMPSFGRLWPPYPPFSLNSGLHRQGQRPKAAAKALPMQHLAKLRQAGLPADQA